VLVLRAEYLIRDFRLSPEHFVVIPLHNALVVFLDTVQRLIWIA
jgi:hypothetical protein